MAASGLLRERDLRALTAVVEDGLRDDAGEAMPWVVLRHSPGKPPLSRPPANRKTTPNAAHFTICGMSARWCCSFRDIGRGVRRTDDPRMVRHGSAP
jgi:hypothetical protein